MSSSKLIKLALIFLLCGCALFFAGIYMGGEGIYINNRFQIKKSSEKEYFEYSDRNLESFSDIKVDISNRPVTIKRSSDGTYGVEAVFRVESSDDVTVKVDNDTLTVKCHGSFSFLSWDFSFGLHDKKEYVIIYLPDKEFGELELSTSNASVNIEDLHAKNLRVDTSNGSITVSALRIEKEAELHTSNGSIEADLAGNESDYDITATTSNGDVSVNGSKQGHKYRSGNGDLKAQFKTSNASIKLNFH